MVRLQIALFRELLCLLLWSQSVLMHFHVVEMVARIREKLIFIVYIFIVFYRIIQYYFFSP